MAGVRGLRRWRAALVGIAVLTVVLVTPSTGEARRLAPQLQATTDVSSLEHGDPIHVVGQGFAPRDYFALAQCAPSPQAVFEDCEYPVEYVHTDAQGRFEADLVADVMQDLQDRTRDCRTSFCAIRAIRFAGPVLAKLPVTFDPAGPDPFQPTVDVTPTTDLRQDDTVHVTGAALPPGETSAQVFVRQCRTPVTRWPDDCDTEDREVTVSAASPLDVVVAVDARVITNEDDHDCRTGGCVLWVGGRVGASDAVLVPLTFDPTSPIGPAPSVTAAPTTDLRDGELVHVDEVGIEADVIGVHQCTATPSGPRHVCDGSVLDANLPSDINVRTVIRSRWGGPVDCRVRACVLNVEPVHGVPYVLPLTFDEDAPVLPRRLRILTDGALTSGQRVDVRGGRFPTDGRRLVRFVQCIGPARLEGLGHRCDPALGSWREPTTASFQVRVVVQRRMLVPGVGAVDCRVRQCRVMMVEPNRRDVWASGRLRL